MKKSNRTTTLILILLLAAPSLLNAQIGNLNDSIMRKVEAYIEETPFYKSRQIEVDEKKIMKIADSWSPFGVYKDTYFATGIPLNTSINRQTADALFQISIRHRLTKSRLPFNSFLYLTYSQKSFWDIYDESAPFRDNNYNPSLGLGRYMIHNNRLKGTLFVQLEHESNGKSGEDSRSWNMLSFSTKYFFNLRLFFGLKAWIPFVDGGENKDLLDYRGLGTISANYINKNGRLWLTAEVNPRKGWGNANTTFTASFKINKSDNQYLYARFYNGKGESLLDYNKYDMNIRIGICIKPDFQSIF